MTVYDADDRTWKVTDQNGRTTETQYNSLGKVAATIDPFGGVTHYDYDARGNLIRTLYPDETETRTAYDDLGRVTWQTGRRRLWRQRRPADAPQVRLYSRKSD